MDKNICYAGNGLFNINNGLYEIENIDFYNSKKTILKGFKSQFENPLKKVLKNIGLKFIELKYFSPREYNFMTDSIDLTIQIINKENFKNEILKFKDKINDALSKNKSYDGYIALTISDVQEELNNLENVDYSPDVIVLSIILRSYIDFSQFDKYDFIIYEEEEV